MSVRTWAIILLAAGVLLVTAAACAPNVRVPPLTPIPTLAPGTTPTLAPAIAGGAAGAQTPRPLTGVADAAAGVGIFLENCTACHGIRGEGTAIAPTLRNNPFITANDQTVFKVIADGVPGSEMRAWAQPQGGPLATDDIYTVMAYLKALQGVPQLPRAGASPPAPAPTPLPAGAPTPQPARPSLPGGPGQALNLTGDINRGRPLFGLYCAECHGPQGRIGRPNPGSDDGTAPSLNPIDSTIASRDVRVFATNIDLFLEHGSIPGGPSPQLMMPAYGDLKLLAPQQIADLIAYIVSLNSP